jgi:tetratricopeptide (TPR) repeat protein
MTLAQALTVEPVPEYLTLPAPVTAPASAPQPALEVEHLYAAARQAWEDGRNYQALHLLDDALDRDPDNPRIVRFMAYAYQATNNREKAEAFLTRAVRLDSEDVQSLFLLARRELEQAHFAAAIHGQARVLRLRPGQLDPALPTVTRYLLGGALEHEGFDAAALEQYHACLASPVNLGRTTRFYRELALLNDERGTLGLLVGDALNRLGQPDLALEAYAQVAPILGDPDQQRDLTRRLVYTNLCLNDPRAAVAAVFADLRQTQADRVSLGLLSYLTHQGLDRANLARDLRPIYAQLYRPEALAVALAQLLDAPAARQFLREHLEARPHDWQAFAALVRLDLRYGAGAPVEALRSTALVLAANPIGATQYFDRLTDAAGAAAPLLAGYRDLTDAQRAQPIQRYLNACALLLRRRTAPAGAQLRQALESDPGLVAARLQLATIDLRLGQLDAADQLLAPLAGRTETPILVLRANVLFRQGAVPQALALLDNAAQANPTDMQLPVAKADLTLARGGPAHAAEAERTLTGALAANPSAEALYQALYTMYAQGLVPDAANKRIQLLNQAMQNIPHNRFVRLCLAGEYARGGNKPRAEQILRGLLEEDPQDYEVLRELLRVLYLQGRLDQARGMVQQLLTAPNPDRALLAAAAWFDVEVAEDLIDKDQPAQAADLLRAALARPTDDPTPLVAVLARALEHDHQVEKIAPLFEQAMADHPEDRTDLRFAWAMLAESLGQWPQSEDLLQAILRDDPDNDQAANALGYTWADQDRNLAPARTLIERAVQARPDSSAYVDSLGWVLYKLGQFQAAQEQLAKAAGLPGGAEPTILNHLGDAQYRLGRKAEALRLWHQAKDLIPPHPGDDDPELKALGPLLDRKIAAADRPAPVARAPAIDGPTTTPATAPMGK